eukprot:762928-Hanusia_phi.AAC.8
MEKEKKRKMEKEKEKEEKEEASGRREAFRNEEKSENIHEASKRGKNSHARHPSGGSATTGGSVGLQTLHRTFDNRLNDLEVDSPSAIKTSRHFSSHAMLLLISQLSCHCDQSEPADGCVRRQTSYPICGIRRRTVNLQ